MPDLTLSEAATRFAESLKDSTRQPAIAELNRFVRWYGDRPLNQLRGHDVSLYAELLGPATPEATRKADYIRAFLQFLRKQGLVGTNLASHLRLRKSAKAAGSNAVRAGDAEAVELTKDGVDALKGELESLIAMRPAIREEIRHAMLDKDFRENSPLDAAKEKQGHVEARIREIESILKRAVVVDGSGHHGTVRVGTTVTVKNLNTGASKRFVIVGPTEANAADGKISSVSPVGKALLGRQEGDEVDVSVPAGVQKFLIEEIVQS